MYQTLRVLVNGCVGLLLHSILAQEHVQRAQIFKSKVIENTRLVVFRFKFVNIHIGLRTAAAKMEGSRARTFFRAQG